MSDLLKIGKTALWVVVCVAFTFVALSCAQSVTQDYIVPKSDNVVALPGDPFATVNRGYVPSPVEFAPTADEPGGPSEDPDRDYTVPVFVDDEPVLYVDTSVWAAVSDYMWTLMPAQSHQEHETTVWYRVEALRKSEPAFDWGSVPAGMPFMSIRGQAG